VIATQDTIGDLAERIERAYSLRRPFWHRGCSAPQVWSTAAATLLQLHRQNPALPVDPELYVAAQSIGTTITDPWAELTQPSSAGRYRQRVGQIIRGLREELRGEIRRAERRIRHSLDVAEVLVTGRCGLSPLGCYIVAQRAGRQELAERFRAAAADQHRSCPLYRQACLRLLPPEDYPVRESPADEDARPTRLMKSYVQLN
jgi:hypothetical protein